MLEVRTKEMVIPDMEELSFTDSQLDYHVRNALKTAVNDNGDLYNQLLTEFNHNVPPRAEEAAALVTCLKALTGAVSCLHIDHHKNLLGAILRMRLWNYGTDVMDALIGFIISLASGGAYVDLCLEAVVINFAPPYCTSYFLELLKQPRGLAKKKEVLDRVHTTLHYIAHVHPLSPSRLENIVRSRMPNIRRETAPLVMYVENMLRLEASALGEMVRSSMMVIIVDTLVELDLEIPWCDILQDDFHKGIFDMELEDLDGHVDHVEPDSNELTRKALIQSLNSGKFCADSLDTLMVLAFEHLRSCHESGCLVQVFDVLIQSFQKTVLTAYKSKFAQFVMFYACSLDPAFCGNKFASLLLDIFVSHNNLEWRMSAVAYLSSYLARAKFVSVSFVAVVLESILDWCWEYCKSQDGGINPGAHKLFYAGIDSCLSTSQATMYVLCFRMRQMIAAPSIKSQPLFVRLKDILGHRLKPLQVCLPSIVEEFLSLAKANGLSSMPQSFGGDGLLESANSQAYGGTQRFNVFFPFDPCLLRKCDSFIRPNYIYWSMVRSSYEEENDDECTSDEDDADVHPIENGMSIPDNGSGRSHNEANSDIDDFTHSLDKMSITPRDLSHKFGGRVQGFSQMPSRIRPSTSPESL